MTGRKALASKWDGLSPHLLATIERCDKAGAVVAKYPAVVAPLKDMSFSIEAGWDPAFANANRSALGALAELGAGVVGLSGLVGSTSGGGVLGQMAGEVSDWAQKSVGGIAGALEGKTGMTKLNTTLIYTGGGDYQLEATAIFRAFSDPLREVEQPASALMSWVLPAHLEAGSRLVGAAGAAMSGESVLNAWFPSSSPPYVRLTYRGKTYGPMVVRSASNQPGGPCDSRGRLVYDEVRFSLRSWMAADADDWARTQGGKAMVTTK